MRGIAALGLAAVALAGATGARAAEPCEERFYPDRPGATNGHWTVGARCFQLEAAASAARQPAGTSLEFPVLTRFGLADRAELRIDNAIVGLAIPDDGSVDVSSTPLGLGVKIMGAEADGRLPGMGVLAGVRAPLGDRFFDDMEPAASLLFDWEFVADWIVSLNAGLSAPVGDEPIRFARSDVAALLWWSVPVPGRWFGIYADAAGGIGWRDGQSWDQGVGGGVAFYPAGNVQIDGGAHVEVTGEDHPVLVQLGVAWRR